jgi:hypothetical protein
MHSIPALSSDGGWLSKYALIGLIQSYTGCYAGSLMTIRSALDALLIDSSSLTEGLDKFSTITSDGVGALEEAIQTLEIPNFKTVKKLLHPAHFC